MADVVNANDIIDRLDAVLTTNAATRDANMTEGVQAQHQAHIMTILACDVTVPALFLYVDQVDHRNIALRAGREDIGIRIGGILTFAPPTATGQEWDDPGMNDIIDLERNVRQILLSNARLGGTISGLRGVDPGQSVFAFRLPDGRNFWHFAMPVNCITTADVTA